MSISFKAAVSAACAFFFLARANAAEIRIAYPGTGTIVNAQIGLILEKTDILKKHGFDAKVRAMGTGRDTKTALVSGQVDLILTSEANFVVLLGEGYDAQALNTLGSAGRAALVVKADSKVKTLADLKGKKMATIFGTSLHQPAVTWAKEAGARLVDISQTGAMRAALEAGAMDAIVSLDPFLEDPLKEGKIRIVKESRFDLINVMSGAYAKAHREDIPKLRAAFTEAVLYMRKNKKEVNAWYSLLAKQSPESIDASSLQNRNYALGPAAPVDLSIGPAFRKRLEEVGAFLFNEKLIRNKPDVASHILP